MNATTLTNQDSSPPAADESSVSDSVLLKRFIASRDEAAFAKLVSRYGGMVLGVCGRVLSDQQDVEDAFQAVFLVMSSDARKIRKRRSIASWLYGVAQRIALRALAQRYRRREEALREDVMGQTNPLAELADRHEQEAVDDELSQLPEKYREPLVLYYLMGYSSRQVAEKMNLSLAATEGRLRRGREQLRARLTRRGIGLAAVLAAIQFSRPAMAAAVTQSLATSTVQAGISYCGPGHSHPLISQEAANLAGKETSTMSIPVPVTATVTTAAIVALAIGISGHSTTSDAAPGGKSLAVQTTADSTEGAKPSTPAITIAVDNQPAKPRQAKPVRAVAVRPAGVKAAAGAGTGRSIAQPAVDYKRRSALETRIETALDDTKWEADFVDITLKDAITQISDFYKIPILFEAKAVNAGDITLEQEINLQVKDVSLRNVLNLILAQHPDVSLEFVIRNGVLQVVTDVTASETVETRVYMINHLKQADTATLVSMIQQAIQPGTWRSVSTAPSAAKNPNYDLVGAIAEVNAALVITHNQRAHFEIAELLDQLKRQGEDVK